ncbi:hypothetical protein Tco_0828425 [Tanacetum coccineum]
MHNNIMAAGSKERPPMLGPGRYSQWHSRFLRYLDTKSNGEYLRKCIFDGPYLPTNVLIAAVEAAENILPVAAHEEVETIHNMTAENKLYFQAEKEAIFLILTGIGDEIYSTVDACNTAKEMWTAIERLQQGESLNVQDVKTNLFWEFGKFTSRDGESMESYYSRFYKLMNELTRNNLQVSPMQVNVQFLQQLQPEWSRFVTVVKQTNFYNTLNSRFQNPFQTTEDKLIRKSSDAKFWVNTESILDMNPRAGYKQKENFAVAKPSVTLLHLAHNLGIASNDMVIITTSRKLKKEHKKSCKEIQNRSVMPSARSQSTANSSKPKPRINNQKSRNWPASKSSCVTTKTVPIAEHSRNSRSFSDSKHFVCSTCQKCVFNANHDSCVTKFLNEVNSRAKVPSYKTTTRYKPVEQTSVAKKPERQIPKRHKSSIKKTSVVHEKTMTPRSCLKVETDRGKNIQTYACLKEGWCKDEDEISIKPRYGSVGSKAESRSMVTCSEGGDEVRDGHKDGDVLTLASFQLESNSIPQLISQNYIDILQASRFKNMKAQELKTKVFRNKLLYTRSSFKDIKSIKGDC